MSFEVDELNEEPYSSLSEWQPLTANHNINFEKNVFSEEKASKIQNPKLHQFDSNVSVPCDNEREKSQKPTTVNFQPSCSINKPRKKLHNICINISSSSDEEDLTSKAQPMLLAECTLESNRRQMHIVESCYEHSSDAELPDLDDVQLAAQQCISDAKEQHEIEEIHYVKVAPIKNKEKVSEKAVKNMKGNKSKPPLQCIHLDIDHHVLELDDAESLHTLLESMDISYSFSINTVNYSILWQREVNWEASADGKVTSASEKFSEDYAMVIFPAQNFVELVQGFKWSSSGEKDTNSILDHASCHKTHLPDKKITYAVVGIDKYFRNKKNQENRRYRSMARGNATGNVGAIPLVSFDDVEEATVCLQIYEDIVCYMVDTMKDLASLIVSFSKGIAEAPEKRQRQKNAFSWYAEGDTYKGIKVSNSDKSLLQLWDQQIRQFSLVSKEVADAIVSHYPSPQLLVEAYKSLSMKEGEMLLKDIVIRRGVGPLVTMKRVGPELSRKIYRFFTQDDESIIV